MDRAVIVAHPARRLPSRPARESGAAPATVVVQETPTGMLDAVLIGARPAPLDTCIARVWITWGDQIAVHPADARATGRGRGRH